MNIDKKYCMSSFLMYRTVADNSKCFTRGGVYPRPWIQVPKQEDIFDSYQLENVLRDRVEHATESGNAALALSGGIDSAILAKFMPKGSVAYTFKCVVPGTAVVDETLTAAHYAEECGLKHRIIEIYWKDFEQYIPLLMQHKGMPFHSIEVQIYKAAVQALNDGFDTLIFGESSDVNYGGLSNLMSRDWKVGEFIERYSYVLPYHVLKEFELITEPITAYERDGYVDVHEFCRNFFLREGMGSYTNACDTAGIKLEAPYVHTRLAVPLDYDRLRAGDGKYIVREVFNRLYPDYIVPPKIPMPRPMNEWMQKWNGPVRHEFWPHCTKGMTGDQKWLVWILEQFLNQYEPE